MSNTNFKITDFTVDATSQELTSVKINNKSFGSNVSLEDNKTATINVSTYTEPVEVTPTSGKDGMKKATITLSNIPSGTSTLYAWKLQSEEEGNVFVYTKDENPVVGDFILQPKTTSENVYIDYSSEITEIGVNNIIAGGHTYNRNDSNDITL